MFVRNLLVGLSLVAVLGSAGCHHKSRRVCCTPAAVSCAPVAAPCCPAPAPACPPPAAVVAPPFPR